MGGYVLKLNFWHPLIYIRGCQKFGIKVYWRLQFLGYLRTLSLKLQKARTKIEVVLSLPCWLSQFSWNLFEIIHCKNSKKLCFLANPTTRWFVLSPKCLVEREQKFRCQVTKLPNYSGKWLEIANALFDCNIFLSFQVRKNISCYILLRLASTPLTKRII